MSSNSFLFINKDASSKSLTNNITETQLGPKSIHKHVQRLSARQRRQQAVNIGTDARAVVGWRNVSHPGSASKAVYIDNTQALADHKIAIDQASRQNGKKVAHGRTTKPAGKSSVHVKLASNPSSEDREDSISRSSDGLSKISASDSIVIDPTSRDLKPEYRRLSIRPPPDTLPNAPIKLTPTEHQVLEYYLREWMPSTTNLPRDCQLIVSYNFSLLLPLPCEAWTFVHISNLIRLKAISALYVLRTLTIIGIHTSMARRRNIVNNCRTRGLSEQRTAVDLEPSSRHGEANAESQAH